MKFVTIVFVLTVMSFAQAQTQEQLREIQRERIQSEAGVFELKDIGLCRYELIGPSVALEKVYEEKPMDFEKCEARARKTLDSNNVGYTKALLKHPSQENWVVIEKKKK